MKYDILATILLLILILAGMQIVSASANTGTMTKFLIDVCEKRIINFEKDVGRYPANVEGIAALTYKPKNVMNWKGPYIRNKNITDEWGNKLKYFYPSIYGSKDFDLYSLGKNRIDNYGEVDDITNWAPLSDKYYYPQKALLKIILQLSIVVCIVIVIFFFLKKYKSKRVFEK